MQRNDFMWERISQVNDLDEKNESIVTIDNKHFCISIALARLDQISDNEE